MPPCFVSPGDEIVPVFATVTPGGTVSDLSTTNSAEPGEIEFAGNDRNSRAVWTTYQKDLVDLGFALSAGTVGVDVRRVGAERAAVAPDEAGFKVAFSGGERIWTSDVTMQSAFVTGFSTPQHLTRGAPQGDLGLTVVNGSPLVVWDEDHRVWLGDARLDGRRRPLD